MPKSDWEYFNCSEKHEHDYVVSLYPERERELIRIYLTNWCDNGILNNSTHQQVYDLIEKVLGLTRN